MKRTNKACILYKFTINLIKYLCFQKALKPICKCLTDIASCYHADTCVCDKIQLKI